MGLDGWWLALQVDLYSATSSCQRWSWPPPKVMKCGGTGRRAGALGQRVTQNSFAPVSLGHEAGSQLPPLSAHYAHQKERGESGHQGLPRPCLGERGAAVPTGSSSWTCAEGLRPWRTGVGGLLGPGLCPCSLPHTRQPGVWAFVGGKREVFWLVEEDSGCDSLLLPSSKNEPAVATPGFYGNLIMANTMRHI